MQLILLLKRPQEIIVFIIGGITFEETATIQSLNKTYAGNIKTIIGGTYVHNFKRFEHLKWNFIK